MSNQTLGLAMIVQNESIHIPVTIAQFYHYIDDIVVVDGGSTDDTVMWCEKMGAKVFHRSFDNNFSKQKNFACDKLKTDWIYLHDPDERLEPSFLEILLKLITPEGQTYLMGCDIIPVSNEYFDCFGIPRKNFIDGVQTSIYPDYQYRLFKNYCRFKGKVHEKLEGFYKRTELDYTRPKSSRPKFKDKIIDTNCGQSLSSVSIINQDQIARFNILHYKSNIKQIEQDKLYKQIEEEY